MTAVLGQLTPERMRAPDWRDDAACRNTPTGAFFPEGHRHLSKEELEAEAQEVCATCPVTGECLTYALETRSRCGVFGGLTAAQRRPLLIGLPRAPYTPQRY